MRGTALALGAIIALTAAGSGRALAAPTTPSVHISNVTSRPGTLKFVLTASDLPPGAQLDPQSVAVTADGTALPATATLPEGGSTQVALGVREVILTLDTSGSMAGDGIAAARAAALAYAAGLPADVRVGIVTFSDAPHVLLRPTTDRGALSRAIGRVQAGGNTALYDGIITAAQVMRGLPPTSQRRLVVLSDGADTSSHQSISDATSTLSHDQIAADVVAFRLPGNQSVLNRLAVASHGTVLPASGAGDLAGAFATAAQAFRQTVVITVQVPASLAAKSVELLASVTVAGQSIAATTTLTLPAAVDSGVSSPFATGSSSGTPHTAGLWVVLSITFVIILTLILIALFTPVVAAERSERQARIAEVNRYRLLAAVGEKESVPDKPSESDVTRKALSFVDRAMRSRGQRDRFVGELERAGVRIRPEEWAVLQACAAVVGGAVIGLLARSPIGAVAGAAVGYAACRIYLRRKIARRAAAFEDQLPDTLQLLAGSLRSGFSLNQALVGVVREGTEPTASEFARALAEVRLGSELEDALDSVADRMECIDLHWVVMAIRISKEVGGNLAEVLQNTVETMRERSRLRGQVRVLTAEGRISAKVLTGLPFLMAGYLLVFRRGYLSPLIHTGVGLAMLAAGCLLLALGTFWLSRLVKIEV